MVALKFLLEQVRVRFPAWHPNYVDLTSSNEDIGVSKHKKKTQKQNKQSFFLELRARPGGGGAAAGAYFTVGIL